ncbi:hypothetical protein GCM10010420_42840 [Streptomyces glaucosporus]|uniref:Helix-turn-helix domain-containing protein n=1 Tax=Streptomyces glaucosporus TaxID=284044 RepID=A0ABP5VU39_9ACTN
MRIVESPFYGDAALSVYMKIKALGQRPEACTAGVATLASYLNLSESTVERGIAQLRAEAPDGIVELPQNRRRSLPGGCGTTAQRRVRPMEEHERFVWLPVRASECLRPRLLRAYAVIAFCVVRKIPLTERELAGFLRHRSGRLAGRPISTDAAGRVIDRLAASGWITVNRRAGLRGRHCFLVYDGRGKAPAPAPPGTATPRPDDGSGSRTGAASLVYKEDPRTDRPDDDGALLPPAVGETQVGRSADGAAGPRPPADGRDGLALRAGGTTAPAPTPPGRTRPPYTGPRLTYSPRVHAVLEPVRPLLGRVNTYVQRLLGREIGRQLDDGAGIERLRARLTERFARTSVEDIRDPGRWLLGVALPRWGCANPDCESGTLWSSGERCPACAEALADRARDRPGRQNPGRQGPPPGIPAPGIPAPRPAATGPGTVRPSRPAACCPVCERPHRPGNSGVCRDCRSVPGGGTGPVPPPASPGGLCRGRTGNGCGRPAPSGLCWRCRTAAPDRPPARTTGFPAPTTYRTTSFRQEVPCASQS